MQTLQMSHCMSVSGSQKVNGMEQTYFVASLRQDATDELFRVLQAKDQLQQAAPLIILVLGYAARSWHAHAAVSPSCPAPGARGLYAKLSGNYCSTSDLRSQRRQAKQNRALPFLAPRSNLEPESLKGWKVDMQIVVMQHSRTASACSLQLTVEPLLHVSTVGCISTSYSD